MKNNLLKFISNHYLIIGICLILAFAMSVTPSYAKYAIQTKQSTSHVGGTDCFKMTFEDDGDSFNLTNTFPMSNTEGVKIKPYYFTIKNICNYPAAFNVNIEELEQSNIDLNLIKYNIVGGDLKTLGTKPSSDPIVLDNAKSSKTIATDYLSYNESKRYGIRMWVNESATKEQVENKTFAFKVVVVSSLANKIITYDAQGGDVNPSSTPIVNKKAQTFPTPTKDGYIFLGWFTKIGAGNQVKASTTYEESTRLYARWEENKYNLTYDLDGGSLETENPTTYNRQSVLTLNNPTKEGYTFSGWSEYVNNITWYDGFVGYGDGSLYEDSTYTDASYSNLIRIKKGLSYKVVGLGGYSPGNVRCRVYKADGTYLGNLGNEAFTATADGYVRIMLVVKATTTVKQSAKLQTTTLQPTVDIVANTTGNRSYVANYTAN